MNLNEIDEPIRDIILQLNKLGYKTTFSCAGYNYPGHIADEIGKNYKLVPQPYIVFKSSLKNARKLAEVLEYGWTIELSHYNTYFLNYSCEEFNHIDGSVYPEEEHYERNEKWRKESWRDLRKCLKRLRR